jgi:hypothetical protein
MTRIAVFAIALAFILGFALLTIEGIAQQGMSIEGALAILVLAILTVGIFGALRNPPRR